MFIRFLFCVFTLICSNSVWSGVVAQSTRLIIDASSHESALSLKNLNEYPVLVQAWIDLGDAETGPDQSDSSFVVLPPIFKMNPGDLQTLRILYLPENKPSDRETLFWLNVLEVPPTTADMGDDAVKLVLTMRTQLKVFVRPRNIKVKPDAALTMLQWQVSYTGNTCRLTVKNPSPYHISFAYLDYSEGEQHLRLPAEMLAPFGNATFDLFSCPATPDAVARFALIDDAGNAREHSVRVSVPESVDASPQPTVQANH